jgi:membrane protein
MTWTTNDRVMAVRRRSEIADVAVSTLEGWRRHQSGRNASLLSFFGFLSIFPLLLVATTILGFVLQRDDDLRRRIVDGALDDIPVLGQQLAENPASLSGSVWALLIGLATALWSATRVFAGLYVSLDDIWEIDLDDRSSIQVQRARAVVGLVIVAVTQIATVGLNALVNAARLPGVSEVLLVALSVGINIAMLSVLYRLLTTASPSWRTVLPGAVSAGVAFSVLQYFGAGIVTRIVKNATDTYGNFALVLGLVTWLGFLAIAALMSAELNATLATRRPPPEPAA